MFFTVDNSYQTDFILFTQNFEKVWLCKNANLDWKFLCHNILQFRNGWTQKQFMDRFHLAFGDETPSKSCCSQFVCWISAWTQTFSDEFYNNRPWHLSLPLMYQLYSEGTVSKTCLSVYISIHFHVKFIKGEFLQVAKLFL